MVQDFHSLCDGNLDSFTKLFNENFKEYSYLVYRKHKANGGDIWQIDVNTLNEKEVADFGLKTLISSAKSKCLKEIVEFLEAK